MKVCARGWGTDTNLTDVNSRYEGRWGNHVFFHIDTVGSVIRDDMTDKIFYLLADIILRRHLCLDVFFIDVIDVLISPKRWLPHLLFPPGSIWWIVGIDTIEIITITHLSLKIVFMVCCTDFFLDIQVHTLRWQNQDYELGLRFHTPC